MQHRPLPALVLGPVALRLCHKPRHRPWRGRARAVDLMVWGKGGLMYVSELLKINLQYKHAQMLSLVLFLQQ